MQKNLSIYLAFFSHFRKCLTNFSVSNSTLITVFIPDVASPKGGFQASTVFNNKNLIKVLCEQTRELTHEFLDYV